MDLNTVRHPEITVQLTGIDGNAFMILGTVQKAMRSAGLEKPEIEEFFAEATAGDYDALLRTCVAWVTVE